MANYRRVSGKQTNVRTKWRLIALLGVTVVSATAQGPNRSFIPLPFPVTDEKILAPFRSDAIPQREDFESLVGYFEDGMEANLEPNKSLVSYVGVASEHGAHRDSVEGFTRNAPLLAVWIYCNSSRDTPSVQRVYRMLSDGLRNGTDPESPGYWGKMQESDQLIVEAADVALAIWLTRDTVWRELSPATRKRVVAWLLQVNGKRIPDNNWHLFVTYVNVVLHAIGEQSDMQSARDHYSHFRRFYRGNGWFSDGPGYRFDYYNAWGIHYQLFWIDQADASFDHLFISTALDQFASGYQYLIGPEGYAVMGRSICYRMAVSTPLILDQFLPHPSVESGVARRALDKTWQYFVRNGSITNGNMTQGFCGKDPAVLDRYSGPASCLWGLRSLISALYVNHSAAFWSGGEKPLPVERGDYETALLPTQWLVRGSHSDVIIIDQGAGGLPVKLSEETPLSEDTKYLQREYRSDRPFCGCRTNHK